jgi:hypothetical protein
MPWNLLILPLVAGYYLLTRSHYLKFKQQRLDRQRLIFESVLVGVLLAVVTYLIRSVVERLFPDLFLVLYNYIPLKTPLIGTSFCTLLLALGLYKGGNLFYKEQPCIEKAIKDVGNEFELLLMASLSDKKLLQFTLDNDKVYIAWVKELPIPSISNYIRVIPAFSGYRDDDTKEVIFTTQYLSVYSEYIKEGLVKSISELNTDTIISAQEVITVSYFDVDMWKRFNLLKSAKDAVE